MVSGPLCTSIIESRSRFERLDLRGLEEEGETKLDLLLHVTRMLQAPSCRHLRQLSFHPECTLSKFFEFVEAVLTNDTIQVLHVSDMDVSLAHALALLVSRSQTLIRLELPSPKFDIGTYKLLHAAARGKGIEIQPV
jgi:hypothetical protein